MTKKQFNSVCSLYHQVSSRVTCVTLIVDICKKKNVDPSTWIDKFYSQKIIQPLLADLATAKEHALGAVGKEKKNERNK